MLQIESERQVVGSCLFSTDIVVLVCELASEIVLENGECGFVNGRCYKNGRKSRKYIFLQTETTKIAVIVNFCSKIAFL